MSALESVCRHRLPWNFLRYVKLTSTLVIFKETRFLQCRTSKSILSTRYKGIYYWRTYHWLYFIFTILLAEKLHISYLPKFSHIPCDWGRFPASQDYKTPYCLRPLLRRVCRHLPLAVAQTLALVNEAPDGDQSCPESPSRQGIRYLKQKQKLQ